MPCSLYNNNGFGCGGCSHFVKSTAIAVSGTNLQITIPNQVIRNNQKFCIALCQSIPDAITQNMAVQIVINGQNFAVIDKCGNAIYADQLRSRTVLHVYLATDTLIAMTSCNSSKLCVTSHGFPVIPVPTAAAAATFTTDTSTAAVASFSVATKGGVK